VDFLFFISKTYRIQNRNYWLPTVLLWGGGNAQIIGTLFVLRREVVRISETGIQIYTNNVLNDGTEIITLTPSVLVGGRVLGKCPNYWNATWGCWGNVRVCMGNPKLECMLFYVNSSQRNQVVTNLGLLDALRHHTDLNIWFVYKQNYRIVNLQIQQIKCILIYNYLFISIEIIFLIPNVYFKICYIPNYFYTKYIAF